MGRPTKEPPFTFARAAHKPQRLRPYKPDPRRRVRALFSQQRTKEFVPAPHIIMSTKQPNKVEIRPNGITSKSIFVTVSYPTNLQRILISNSVVKNNGVAYTETHEAQQESKYTVIGYFDAAWRPNTARSNVTERATFWVCANELPSQVLWTPITSPSASCNKSSMAFPSKLNRSSEEKRKDKEKADDQERKRQQKQQEAKEKMVQKYQEDRARRQQ